MSLECCLSEGRREDKGRTASWATATNWVGAEKVYWCWAKCNREEEHAPFITVLTVLGHECHPAARGEEHSYLQCYDNQCWGAEHRLGRYGHPPADHRAIRMHASWFATFCLWEAVWRCDKNQLVKVVPGGSGCAEGTWAFLKLTPGIGHWDCSVASYQRYLLLLTWMECLHISVS